MLAGGILAALIFMTERAPNGFGLTNSKIEILKYEKANKMV